MSKDTKKKIVLIAVAAIVCAILLCIGGCRDGYVPRAELVELRQ
jgi:hypothetical protein